MAEMLKEWLTKRLQRPITWEAEVFGDKMKNGYIISCVLRSYHIINDEKHYLIRPSNIGVDIKNNWQLIKEWMRDLEINLTDDDTHNIIEGKGSTLLRLFYQLFLHLDKMDRTNFIKQERKKVSGLVDKMEHRFTINKVEDKPESFVDKLSKPLLDQRQFIEWQRKKAKDVQETYDYIRHKYSKMLAKIEESKTPLQHSDVTVKKRSAKNKKEMEEFSLRYPCEFKNYTYEDLLELEKKAVERQKSLIDTEWAKNYIDNLYIRMHKKSDSEEFQKQIRNVLSGSLWDLSVAKEEFKLDTELSKKVMKLSQFEKQMCTQIMETKQQARNLAKNRIQGETEFADQRMQQFNQFLDNVKAEMNLGFFEIDFEKKRQNMLHKKLYAEKIKRKRQHYYEICYETILSIIDFATKYAYFKRLLNDKIPNHYIHEWKALYFRQQPIFDIYQPIENILRDTGIEEKPSPKEEEIIRLELDRQEALNDIQFNEYHNYTYPWQLELLIPNYDPEAEERKYEYLGSRILGHLVYTLLEIKYPYPPQRLPADLHTFSTKAVVRGLPDRSITIALQTLLNNKKIHVVRLESAINYCLRRFKIEMIGCTDIELSFDKFMAVAQEDEDKELIKSIKTEDEILSKDSEILPPLAGPFLANTKQTQTPKTIPEEEITLSNPAELGRYAYESLNFGESLTDHLLSAMLVEYIKDQNDINGFVIINYPNTYREAQILEETFSGRSPPDEGDLDDRDEIYLEESIISHRKKDKDPHKEVRVSKLVNDPHKKKISIPFTSYFTCYLNLKETEDILQEFVVWYLTAENSEMIDRFYAALGINYSMYYEVIEKEQLALICKYILGDYTLYIESDDKIFGENVLSCLDFPSSDDKRTKSKIVKPETSIEKPKEKLGRHSKFSKPFFFFNDLKVVKAPDSVEVVQNDELVTMECSEAGENGIKSFTTLTIVEEIDLLAGEEDWEYSEIPISDIIGVALASCWEEIEKTYIYDMQQLFFGIRIQMNCLIPYTRFIKDKMEQIITLPSRKQDLVSTFLQEYNDFENDWRDINLTKNEWHCRIKELQNKLYKICDQRKLHAEKQRYLLICENWTMEELTTMVNTYISCMQTELNRAMLTYQSLHDFYFAMIKRCPPHDRLTSKELTKIFRESDETSGSRKGGEDKVYRQLKNSFQELQLKNIKIDYSNNPFDIIVENNVKFAFKVIKDVNDSYRSLISREYSEIAKIVPPTKKKDEDTSEESINAEKFLKQNALKCIEEWTMGINGEMFRANLRLLALQYKCYRDMKLFNDSIHKAFMDIQNNIDTYYLNEIKSVDRLCKYLQMAVEGGKRIQENLILENDTFIIDPNLIHFSASEDERRVKMVKELVNNIQFKIGQLAKLRSQFKIVAPTGIALQQAFIFLLQDFLYFSKESCDGPLFPKEWTRVDPEQIPKLVILLFGETTYVYWIDFLIYCLNIRFPTVEELLLLRKNFRCHDLESTELISREDFINEILWFEKDFNTEDRHAQLRIVLMKHFLFELFETAENVMNYSAFLLAFCKSVNPIEGFASALAMADGKKICFSLTECEKVVCRLIRDKEYRDECLACAFKCTALFLEKIITNVINICEGTTIYELEYTELPPDIDKRGKKSKGVKAKKIESSVSARLPKIQKSAPRRSKTQSATDIKSTTFICRPCEPEVEIVEEKPPQFIEPEEEPKVEPLKDPTLAYAVSQSVIWNVLNVCLPWYFWPSPKGKVTPVREEVEEVMKQLEVNTDNKHIYVCQFVSEPSICKILHKSKKFVALNLAEEIQNVCM
ncbi:sperm flagellar protein 2-like [Pararge aegeria]|uniref:Jg7300 protein n=1 Tax=Pararge aegeria aegeria TaxID=348720 RepID=A0A8S4RHV1_9NEOP|nr:sperm flagellar protein 2-like [Pararge aegeria]CAH2236008.1 jg7300 [Pararge aegeria aegeria]